MRYFIRIGGNSLNSTIAHADELGYLPVDNTHADLLFQIPSGRSKKGSAIIATDKICRKWSRAVSNDAPLGSAKLGRILNQAETVLIKSKNYHTKVPLESQ